MKKFFTDMTTAEIVQARYKLANYKCEYCGGTEKMEFHHITDKDKFRHDFYECVESGRILCYPCHHGKNMGTVRNHYRKEFDEWLRSRGYSDQEIMNITGRQLYA